MISEIKKIRKCFDDLFGNEYLGNCFIEILNNEYETVLSANKEGMLLLVNELLELCIHDKIGNHYHLDEGGMARKCDRPVVIELIKENWSK